MQLLQKHLRLFALRLIEAADELIKYYKGYDREKHYALIKIRDELAVLVENRKI